MTNLEYIRSLGAKEIADIICSDDGYVCGMCVDGNGSICNGNCWQGTVDWLFAEHEKELKHCPFCGGEPKTLSYSDGWYVRCEKCKVETDTRETEEEAIKAWNRRVDKE